MFIFNQILFATKFFIFLSIVLIIIKIKKDVTKNKIEEGINKNNNTNITNINENILNKTNYINNSNVYNNIEIDREIERKKMQDFEDIKRYSQFLDPNDSLIEEERRTILNLYFPRNPNRTNITIIYDLEFPFGNQILFEIIISSSD